jgi:hypothetical protein
MNVEKGGEFLALGSSGALHQQCRVLLVNRSVRNLLQWRHFHPDHHFLRRKPRLNDRVFKEAPSETTTLTSRGGRLFKAVALLRLRRNDAIKVVSASNRTLSNVANLASHVSKSPMLGLSGCRKWSKDHNSLWLFWMGVPVSSILDAVFSDRTAWYNRDL